jgi:hypothetical protein
MGCVHMASDINLPVLLLAGELIQEQRQKGAGQQMLWQQQVQVGFIVSLCPIHTRTCNMIVTASTSGLEDTKWISDTQVWCDGSGLLFSVTDLQAPWDPGGLKILHRLGGKPKLKKGGMLGITQGWAVIWALGLGLVKHSLDCRSSPTTTRAQEQYREDMEQLIRSLLFIFLPK